MGVDDGLVLLSLGFLAYGVFSWAWQTYGRRQASAPSVKHSAPRRAFKPRSQRSNVQNPTNAGSEQQDAPEPAVNVQPVESPAAAIAPVAAEPSAPSADFTLTPRELVQLAEAIRQRGEGATVEAAICGAFGVTKGGSEGYKRAKALFDAATVLPGSAPAGTYQAPAPARRPARRRRAGA